MMQSRDDNEQPPSERVMLWCLVYAGFGFFLFVIGCLVYMIIDWLTR